MPVMKPYQLLLTSLFAVVALSVGAQGTLFSYQGQLNSSGRPAGGFYDMRFTIWDALTNGNLVAGPLTNSATGVTNGLFAVMLDFGNGVFTGPPRWLQQDVRTKGKGAFTTLHPRQQILPMPYAFMANTASNLLGPVPAGHLSGTVPLSQLPGAVLTNNANGVNLTGTFRGNGGGLLNVNAATAAVATNLVGLTFASVSTATTNFMYNPAKVTVYQAEWPALIGDWYYWMTNVPLTMGIYTNAANHTNYLVYNPNGSYFGGWQFDSSTNDSDFSTDLFDQSGAYPYSPRNPWEYGVGSALPGTPSIIVADFGFNLISITSATNSQVVGPPYVSNPSIYNPLSSLLNFPVVGPSQSFVNRAGFNNIPYMTNTLTRIGLLFLPGGAGVVRGIQVMPTAGLTWANRSNYWLRIYADGGGMSPLFPNPNCLVFNAPLVTLASCKYLAAGPINYAWSSRYVDVQIAQTNISFGNPGSVPEMMVNLKLTCPFTNGIYISLYDSSLGQDISTTSAFSTVNYSTCSSLANFPFSNWRLRSSFMRSNVTNNSPLVFLNVTNKPGVLIGLWGSVDTSHVQAAFENTWIIMCDNAIPPWQSSGGEDLPLNPYEFTEGGGILQFDFGTPSWKTNYVEFYRQFNADAIYWTNSAVGTFPPSFATSSNPVPTDILAIYYAP